jgi:hypothetical protein
LANPRCQSFRTFPKILLRRQADRRGNRQRAIMEFFKTVIAARDDITADGIGRGRRYGWRC